MNFLLKLNISPITRAADNISHTRNPEKTLATTSFSSVLSFNNSASNVVFTPSERFGLRSNSLVNPYITFPPNRDASLILTVLLAVKVVLPPSFPSRVKSAVLILLSPCTSPVMVVFSEATLIFPFTIPSNLSCDTKAIISPEIVASLSMIKV